MKKRALVVPLLVLVLICGIVWWMKSSASPQTGSQKDYVVVSLEGEQTYVDGAIERVTYESRTEHLFDPSEEEIAQLDTAFAEQYPEVKLADYYRQYSGKVNAAGERMVLIHAFKKELASHYPNWRESMIPAPYDKEGIVSGGLNLKNGMRWRDLGKDAFE